MLCPILCCHALTDKPSMSTCAAVRCDRDAVARGLWMRCYARNKRGLGGSETRQYTMRGTKDRVRYEVTAHREAGESIADIAAPVGVNESTLVKWFREWGMRPAVGTRGRSLATSRWKPWTREDAVVAYTRTDLPVAERAAMLGRSYTAVAGYVRDNRQRSSDSYGIK